MPTAPDGMHFEDRNEWKRYMMENFYSFRRRQGESLAKQPGTIDGQPFELEALSDCEVLLLDHMDQTQVDELQNCRVFIGAASASVYVRQCRNCVFTVACQQLRVLESHGCTFYLLSKTDPSIEHSDGLAFAPFNGEYPEHGQHLTAAGLDLNENRWSSIYDWNDPDKTGVHWRILPEEERSGPWFPAVQTTGSAGTSVLNGDAGGGGREMQSFGFDTDQRTAQATVDSIWGDGGAAGLPQEEQVSFASAGGSGGAPFGTNGGSAADGPTPINGMSGGVPTYGGSDGGGGTNGSGGGGFSGVAADLFNAADSSVAAQQQRAFEKAVTARRKREAAAVEAALKRAEEEQDAFYDLRTDRAAHRQSLNQEHEESIHQQAEELDAMATTNPWAKVCALVDLKLRAGDEETEFATRDRLRSLLIQLKAEGEQRRAASAAGAVASAKH